MYDVIVVGARCAGSPTAMLLARRGYRVLLVDKARFPTDTMSGHYVHQPGVAALARWRLLDRVAATNAPPVARWTFDAGCGLRLVGSPPAVDGVRAGYCVRRRVFDKILVDAAVEAGAELREGFTVAEVVRDNDGRVTGIRGQAAGGQSVTERARLVVGADGLRSIVARTVGATHTRYVPPLTCSYYAYFDDVPLDGVEVYPREGCFLVAAPTNDGLTMVAVIWPQHEFVRRRVDLERNWIGSIREHAPALAGRVAAGRRVEKLVGTPVLPNYVRKPFGLGWALVGDAGYMKDPITAQGMTDAARDAELLSGAVHAAFIGRTSMPDALAWYERQRDLATAPMFDHTIELARLGPMPAPLRAAAEAIVDRPEEVSRFLGTISGATPIPQYFSEANLSRLAGKEPVAA